MSRRAPVALAAALLVGVAAAPARAGEPTVVEDPVLQFSIALPSELRPAAAPPGAVIARTTAAGLVVTVSRVDHPNRDAWRGRDRFFAQVERGVADASPGYRALRSRRHRLSRLRVPALDLGFRRDGQGGPERVAMRFLFFRRYSLVLTIAGPARAHRRARTLIGATLRSFQPYFGPAD